MAGEFTDRGDALAAANRLLAGGSDERILMYFGVTGQGKSTLLRRLVQLNNRRYKGQIVDMQSLVMGVRSFDGVAEQHVEQLAILLLQGLGTGIALQAPWWQRPKALQVLAQKIGLSEYTSRTIVWQWLWKGATNTGSPLTAQSSSQISTELTQRHVWLNQLDAIARRLRRRRLLLLIDSCEWMWAFDEASLASATHHSQPEFSPWVLGQVIPRLLRSAPRLKVILAGWDNLQVDVGPMQREHASIRLTSWGESDTILFLESAGVKDPEVAAEIHRACEGIPLLTAVVVEEVLQTGSNTEPKWADLQTQIRSRSAQEWVPDLILSRLTADQQQLLAAAAVLRVVTQGALSALMPGRLEEMPGAFRRLALRSFMEEVSNPATTSSEGASVRSWRMQPQIRRWLVDYLTAADSGLPLSKQRLPNLHRLAKEYFSEVAEQEASSRWALEATHHSFAIGDSLPAAEWEQKLLDAIATCDMGILAAYTEVVMPILPEVRRSLPNVGALALSGSAWAAFTRGDWHAAESFAGDAASIFGDIGRTADEVWARTLAGQSAWERWDRAGARAHWIQALTDAGVIEDQHTYILLSAALARATLGCGDLHAALPLIRQTIDRFKRFEEEPLKEGGADRPGTPPIAVILDNDMVPDLILQAIDVAVRAEEADLCEELVKMAGPEIQKSENAASLQARLLNLRAQNLLARRDLGASTELFMEASGEVAARQNAQAIELLLTRSRTAAVRSNYGVLPVGLPAWLSSSTPSQSIPVLTMSSQSPWKSAELARDLALEAKELAGRLGEKSLEARSALLLGETEKLLSAHSLKEEHFLEALAISRAIGDKLGEANALLELSRAAVVRDTAVSEAKCDEAMNLFDELRYAAGRANVRHRQGDIAARRGEDAVARMRFTEALSVWEQLGNLNGRADTCNALGDVVRMQRDFDGAEHLYRMSLEFYQGARNLRGQTTAIADLGIVYLQRGEFDEGERHLTSAVLLFTQLGNLHQANQFRRHLAESALVRRRIPQAKSQLEPALEHARSIGDRHCEAEALMLKARIAESTLDFMDAEKSYGRALSLYRMLGEPTNVGRAGSAIRDLRQRQANR